MANTLRVRTQRSWWPCDELDAFPWGEHDDDVDACTQLLVQWRGRALSAEEMVRILSIGEETTSWLRGSGEPDMPWTDCL